MINVKLAEKLINEDGIAEVCRVVTQLRCSVTSITFQLVYATSLLTDSGLFDFIFRC